MKLRLRVPQCVFFSIQVLKKFVFLINPPVRNSSCSIVWNESSDCCQKIIYCLCFLASKRGGRNPGDSASTPLYYDKDNFIKL